MLEYLQDVPTDVPCTHVSHLKHSFGFGSIGVVQDVYPWFLGLRNVAIRHHFGDDPTRAMQGTNAAGTVDGVDNSAADTSSKRNTRPTPRGCRFHSSQNPSTTSSVPLVTSAGVCTIGKQRRIHIYESALCKQKCM